MQATYTWAADGTKLKAQNHTSGFTTDYVGPYPYENGTLAFFFTAEGRCIKSGASYVYEYVIKDHLGNTRATFDVPSGTTARLTQATHYYPFGLEIGTLAYTLSPGAPNDYKYNGKELQVDFGLPYYDYGARMYDATLGRWHSVDPLAEKGPKWNPYTYCGNNPLRYFDPDGMWFDEANGKKAAKIEQKINKRIDKLNKEIAKIEANKGDIGDKKERVAELQKSKSDISDMRANENTQFAYGKVTDKRNKDGGPTTMQTGTNDKGQPVITMFTESNMGSILHETRHGGQHSRNELGSNYEKYGVQDEVSAYRAQYSYDGKLKLPIYTDYENKLVLAYLISTGQPSLSKNIVNINEINPQIINKLVDGAGTNQLLIYPPLGISQQQWNEK